ncbi:MAG: glutamine--tRNA ligase/YqeY domain fusion protein [Betaproteobacteria bacterium]|nr:glutamine--tRNA ligase/YqeY domain fusion protein [Betaproteobacteria bacterium]NBP37903.1 glutamine--tRNA ligase/YqeY domain fusion protein [Betaproteobacteria bacterium]NBQ77756.1 glutamine--tRNA ligase/YqeY domain fusion protein [Betaproteobacteria bacterium]NBQ94176.1 glutamine--tRNA ligase/YqeY domain fusion protein [Betaproteobacteria bacterium]NBS38488.1 glutamine--tRNA ligase/YqeY domain fusion protein [Betaproteobacteria bacterium]
MAEPSPPKAAAAPHFIRAIIDHDLASGRLNHRSWAGFPSDARQAANQADQATIRTRFPPEPNGYLHIGHAKSICLNFGLAKHYGGRCHMRFDDTNPVKEDQEFVDSILDTVSWLGFSWEHEQEKNLYYASDYFQSLFDCAEYLIKASHAYVDEQSPEDMRARRGSLTEPGEDSPFRDRPAEESLRRFREMRAGKHAEGSMVLRARIDMRSPNLNMRDPALYRIRFAEHHRTGNQWCIYPMYDYAHPISDALENITHSLCTLEFEDHRPFYDWVLERLAEGGFLRRPLPQQTEFARLNLYYTVTSKRKLQELVSSGRVKGWDDPRMPTLVGLRRRGFTPESIQLFCERIGVSKANQWVDPSVLDIALRDDLETKAKRATAVIDPVGLEIENWPHGHRESCKAPWHPHHPDWGDRQFYCTASLWVERDDVKASAEKGFFRLFPGNRVRLRYGFVIECTAVDVDPEGHVLRVKARYFPDSRSGTAGADNYKVKGNIHWISADEALAAEVHLYENLFSDPQPDSGDKDWLSLINKASHRVVHAWLEPSLAHAKATEHFQFERLGYFVADRRLHRSDHPVFQRTVSLKQANR